MEGSATISLRTREAAAAPVRGRWYLLRRRFRRHKLAWLSAIVLALIFLTALAAPLLAPYDPNKLDHQLARFGRPAPPSVAHPFGSDGVGRDLLSRIIYGGRVSLLIGFLVTGISVGIGATLGAIAGYVGSWPNTLILRLAETLLALPPLLLLMAFLVAIRPTIISIAILLGAISWMNVARLVRGEFLVLREKEFVEAARVIGASAPAIIARHLLPNAISPIIVAASLNVPGAILTESTLSFLGFGIQPPTASWGNMLQGAFSDMRAYHAWWLGIFPGAMIAVTVLSFNFVGDGLRDALDPRSDPP